MLQWRLGDRCTIQPCFLFLIAIYHIIWYIVQGIANLPAIYHCRPEIRQRAERRRRQEGRRGRPRRMMKTARHEGRGDANANPGAGLGLHFGSKKRLNFSINPRKLSILYRTFSNRGETLGIVSLVGYWEWSSGVDVFQKWGGWIVLRQYFPKKLSSVPH